MDSSSSEEDSLLSRHREQVIRSTACDGAQNKQEVSGGEDFRPLCLSSPNHPMASKRPLPKNPSRILVSTSDSSDEENSEPGRKKLKPSGHPEGFCNHARLTATLCSTGEDIDSSTHQGQTERLIRKSKPRDEGGGDLTSETSQRPKQSIGLSELAPDKMTKSVKELKTASVQAARSGSATSGQKTDGSIGGAPSRLEELMHVTPGELSFKLVHDRVRGRDFRRNNIGHGKGKQLLTKNGRVKSRVKGQQDGAASGARVGIESGVDSRGCRDAMDGNGGRGSSPVGEEGNRSPIFSRSKPRTGRVSQQPVRNRDKSHGASSLNPGAKDVSRKSREGDRKKDRSTISISSSESDGAGGNARRPTLSEMFDTLHERMAGTDGHGAERQKGPGEGVVENNRGRHTESSSDCLHGRQLNFPRSVVLRPLHGGSVHGGDSGRATTIRPLQKATASDGRGQERRTDRSYDSPGVRTSCVYARPHIATTRDPFGEMKGGTQGEEIAKRTEVEIRGQSDKGRDGDRDSKVFKFNRASVRGREANKYPPTRTTNSPSHERDNGDDAGISHRSMHGSPLSSPRYNKFLKRKSSGSPSAGTRQDRNPEVRLRYNSSRVHQKPSNQKYLSSRPSGMNHDQSAISKSAVEQRTSHSSNTGFLGKSGSSHLGDETESSRLGRRTTESSADLSNSGRKTRECSETVPVGRGSRDLPGRQNHQGETDLDSSSPHGPSLSPSPDNLFSSGTEDDVTETSDTSGMDNTGSRNLGCRGGREDSDDSVAEILECPRSGRDSARRQRRRDSGVEELQGSRGMASQSPLSSPPPTLDLTRSSESSMEGYDSFVTAGSMSDINVDDASDDDVAFLGGISSTTTSLTNQRDDSLVVDIDEDEVVLLNDVPHRTPQTTRSRTQSALGTTITPSTAAAIQQLEDDEAMALRLQLEFDQEETDANVRPIQPQFQPYSRVSHTFYPQGALAFGNISISTSFPNASEVFFNYSPGPTDWVPLSPSTRAGRRRRGRGRSRGHYSRRILPPDPDPNDYERLLALAEQVGPAVPQGLCPTILSRLPTFKFQEDATGSMSDDDKQCTICMSEYREREDLRRLPCFHAYHTNCIDQWFQNSSACPVCREHVRLD